MFDLPDAPDPETARRLGAAQAAHDLTLILFQGAMERPHERKTDGFNKASPSYYQELAEAVVRLAQEYPEHAVGILAGQFLESIERHSWVRQDRRPDLAVSRRELLELQEERRHDPNPLFR